MKQTVILAISLIMLAGLANAQEPAQSRDKPVKLDESYRDAFLNYEPYKRPAAPSQQQQQTVAPSPVKAPEPSPAASVPVGPQKVTVEWLKKVYPVLQERSVNNPTEENVTAEKYVQRIIFDKAQRYAEKSVEITNRDPLLNENNRVPYASAGALSVRNADYRAQEQAVRELATIGGIVVFVDGTCRFCSQQLPVIERLRRQFGLEYLVVSLDGSIPKGFNGKVSRDNGLFNKLGLKLTPSVVFVPSPKGYKNGADPNQYFVVSQGFYAQDEMAKQIAYAGHFTNLLSADTMRDLDVWDRGVASVKDLDSIELDATKPETFKQVLQPVLQKQYK
ncbi:conjugal transfer protein [Pelomonas sp. HMWF004]|nr:conjugal transfer protein [Pelomonas sp. HMWF004]